MRNSAYPPCLHIKPQTSDIKHQRLAAISLLIGGMLNNLSRSVAKKTKAPVAAEQIEQIIRECARHAGEDFVIQLSADG